MTASRIFFSPFEVADYGADRKVIVHIFYRRRQKYRPAGPASVRVGAEVAATGIAAGCGSFRNSASQNFTGLKRQGLGLLDLRQRLHLGEHIRRHRTVDLDQCDGVAARFVAAESRESCEELTEQVRRDREHKRGE